MWCSTLITTMFLFSTNTNLEKSKHNRFYMYVMFFFSSLNLLERSYLLLRTTQRKGTMGQVCWNVNHVCCSISQFYLSVYMYVYIFTIALIRAHGWVWIKCIITVKHCCFPSKMYIWQAHHYSIHCTCWTVNLVGYTHA